MKFFNTIFTCGVVLFLLIIWIPVEAAWASYCFNNYDLGIYSQAIQQLSWTNLNPWLSVRNLFLFNDHFEPVFFLFQPFKSFLPVSLMAIRVDTIAVIVAALAPVWLRRKKVISSDVAICGAAIILFSPLTLDASFFPAHPGTWSMAPLAWMFAFLITRRDGAAIFMFVLICFCKEEYPVMGFVLGASLFYGDRKKIGGWFCFISAVWGVGVFVVRPWMIGPARQYTDAVSQGTGLLMFLEPQGLKKLVMRHLQLFLPLVPLLCWSSVSWSIGHLFKVVRHRVLLPMICLLAMLGIRFAGGFWDNHRVAPLAVISAFVVIYWLGDRPLARRKIQWFTLLLLALSFPSLELGSRYWRGKSFKKHCPTSEGRLESLRVAADYLRHHVDGAVLASGNLIPPLVDLPGISHVGAATGEEFKYFFVEKNLNRNTWPIEPQDFDRIEESWRKNPSSRVVLDDEYILLLVLVHESIFEQQPYYPLINHSMR